MTLCSALSSTFTGSWPERSLIWSKAVWTTCSARLFLPRSITLLTSRCTITLLYIGSGPTSRCGACPFLGISLPSSFELQLCVVQLESWRVGKLEGVDLTLQLFNFSTLQRPYLGRLAPYLLRPCRRSATPAESMAPRIM